MKNKELDEALSIRGYIKSGNKAAKIARLFKSQRKLSEEDEEEVKAKYFGKNPGLSEYFRLESESEMGFKANIIRAAATIFDCWPEEIKSVDQMKNVRNVGKGTLRRMEAYFASKQSDSSTINTEGMPPLESTEEDYSKNEVVIAINKLKADNEDGVSIDDIIKETSKSKDEITKTLEKLVENSIVMPTIDDEHYLTLSE